MIKTLRSLVDIGIDSNTDLKSVFKIRFVNGLHILILIILLIGITNWIILNKLPFTIIEGVCLALSIVGLILNKWRYFNASLALFYIYTNILIIYNVELYPVEVAGYAYYFPFAMVLGINNMSVLKNKITYSFLLLSFIVFLIVIFLDLSFLIPKSWYVTFSNHEIDYIRSLNIAIAGLCVVFFTAFYMWLSNKQTEEIKILIQKEKDLHEELKQSLMQKEILLAEVHHRVKNNLAVLNSMINMKMNNHNNQNIDQILNSLQNRIHNMSMIHNLLYRQENIDSIKIEDFIQKTIQSSIQYNQADSIQLIENYDELGTIKTAAIIPIGIIVNEMVTNSILHAFPNKYNPTLNLNIYMQGDDIVINYSDNGMGLNNSYQDGLGFEIIYLLVEQLNGQIRLEDNNGLHIKINIPKNELVN